jgi:hypothetical protein
MTTTIRKRTIFDALLFEPLDLAISQPHQMFISALSVYLVASEAAMLAPAPFNWLMAVGAEWAYLRGLSSGETVATVWNKRLIASAIALLVLYGSLWGLRQFGALPKERAVADGTWAIAGAVVLTLIHILSIGAVTFCSAMIHRDVTEAARVSRELVVAEQDERNRRNQAVEQERNRKYQEAHDAIELDTRRQKAKLQLEDEAARRKMQLTAERAQLRSATRPAVASATTRAPIIVDSVAYPSVQAAADAHGITRQAMSKRLKKEE